MKYILSIVAILSTLNVMAQSMEKEHYHKNDLGIANEMVFLSNENAWAYGIDVHYIQNIKDSNFGIGAGFEHIFGKYDHNTVGIVGRYIPMNDWIINLSPGITFENSNIKFSTHAGISYVFDVSVFHFGPVISYATDFEEAHIGFGLHIGYGF